VYSTAGVDYVPVDEKLTFSPSIRSLVIMVVTIDDEQYENDGQPERICLRMNNLSEPCPNPVIIGDDRTVNITENDCKFVCIYHYRLNAHLNTAELFELMCYTTTTSNSTTGWHINLFYSIPGSFVVIFQCALDDDELQQCM